MGIHARINLAKAFFSPTRDFPFSVGGLVRGVVKPPCTRIGPRYVESIDSWSGGGSEFLRVRIRGVATPLCWPATLPLFDLYKVAAECFDPFDWHFYEAPETRVAPGDVVVDCGAAEGMFSLRVLERAGRVIAFEPFAAFGESLERTFGPSGKVTVVPYAVSDAEGRACLDGGSLYGVVRAEGEAPDGTPIEVVTLDGWRARNGLPRVDYIKADLEGFEMKMLRGALETIRSCRPRIAMTVYHQGNDWRALLALLREAVPEYQYRLKGLAYTDGDSTAHPVMIHAWAPAAERSRDRSARAEARAGAPA